MRNEKIKSTDEFLIKKQDPLRQPPDFETIPEPGSNQVKDKAKKNKVKELIKPEDIETIKTVTDDLGNASRIKARSAKTFIPMSENKKTIKNFSGGEDWLKANPDSTKTINNQNVWRKKNARRK